MKPVDLSKKLQQARHFMQLENHAAALTLYARLVRELPRANLWGEYAHAAARSGDFDLAARLWNKVREFEPNSAELLAGLAREHQKIRLHAQARALHAEAAALEPRNLALQLDLAWLLARTDSVAAARAAVDKCLELDSTEEQARYLAAHLDRRENQLASAESQFRALIAAAPRDPYVHYACYSELAAILDRTGRFEEAMAQLAEGKNFARQRMGAQAEDATVDDWYENQVRQARALPKNLLELWGKTFAPKARSAAAPLAFLTGPARSGTTLLERILDAHPAIAATDEALAFQTLLPAIHVRAPISAPQLNLWRHRYQKNLRQVLGAAGEGKLLLDKNPSKTDWLPALLRLFPDLRVIIAVRDPRDVIVSLYFQNQSQTNHLTLERLARYYRNVMDLWLAIRSWEGLAWLQTRYEDTVANLEKEGGRVTQFLGLAWHENQARFFEKNREKPVMSTNYSDVTQPVYNRSVGRWRVYEKQLAPVLPELEPYCKEFGYA